MNEILTKIYEMTAFSNISADTRFLIMYALAFVLLTFVLVSGCCHLQTLLVGVIFNFLIADFCDSST